MATLAAQRSMTWKGARQAQAIAISTHAPYPQYTGFFETPDWQPVCAMRTITGKAGTYVMAGDLVIARPTTLTEFLDHTNGKFDVYCPRTNSVVLLNGRDFAEAVWD